MDALDHQREALAEIVARGHAFFRGEWWGLSVLPVQPRWASIIVGGTGTGKTAVASMAAASLSELLSSPVSLLRISAPSWVPCGAHQRGTRETVTVIAEHVARHEKALLCIDEIDKLIGGTGGVGGTGGLGGDTWQSYIRSETYDLLDGRWPTGLQMPDGPLDENDCPTDISISELTRRLQQNVFVVGIGTFQSWFDGTQSRRTIGYGATDPTEEVITADIIADRMPRELANRWNSSIIRIPELRPEDYHRIAKEAEVKLPERMRGLFRMETERRIPGAITAKKGVRFLEEAIMEVLKKLPPEPATITAEFVKVENQTETHFESCML